MLPSLRRLQGDVISREKGSTRDPYIQEVMEPRQGNRKQGMSSALLQGGPECTALASISLLLLLILSFCVDEHPKEQIPGCFTLSHNCPLLVMLQGQIHLVVGTGGAKSNGPCPRTVRCDTQQFLWCQMQRIVLFADVHSSVSINEGKILTRRQICFIALLVFHYQFQ